MNFTEFVPKKRKALYLQGRAIARSEPPRLCIEDRFINIPTYVVKITWRYSRIVEKAKNKKKHPKAWGTPGVLAILLTYFMKSALEWATLK